MLGFDGALAAPRLDFLRGRDRVEGNATLHGTLSAWLRVGWGGANLLLGLL